MLPGWSNFPFGKSSSCALLFGFVFVSWVLVNLWSLMIRFMYTLFALYGMLAGELGMAGWKNCICSDS